MILLEQILAISISEPEYVEILDGSLNVDSYIDYDHLKELIEKELGGKADEDELDFLDNILNCNSEEVDLSDLSHCVDRQDLIALMDSANEEYCESENLCPVCRAPLSTVSGGKIEAWGHITSLPDEVVCKNGCI